MHLKKEYQEITLRPESNLVLEEDASLMRYINLFDESKNSSCEIKKIKRFLMRAAKDVNIFLFVKSSEDMSVWEYRHECEEHYFSNIGWSFPEKFSFGEKVNNIFCLMLDNDVVLNLALHDGSTEIKASSFPAALVKNISTGELDFEYPDLPGYKYYLYPSDKINAHFFSENDNENIKFIDINYRDLVAGVDIIKVDDLDGLIKDYPELSGLPDEVNEILKNAPVPYKGTSLRLLGLIDAYKEFWLNALPWDELEIEKAKEIHRGVIERILKDLENESIGSGAPLGRPHAIDAAGFILPELFRVERDGGVNKVRQVLASSNVPRKLWFIHCLSEALLENRGPIDGETTKEFRGHMVRVLTALNRQNKTENLNGPDQVLLSAVRFRHPELKYFRTLKFTKDEAECAARICLPNMPG